MQVCLNGFFYDLFFSNKFSLSKAKLIKFKLLTTTVIYKKKNFVALVEDKNETQLTTTNWCSYKTYVYDATKLNQVNPSSVNKKQINLITKKIFYLLNNRFI